MMIWVELLKPLVGLSWVTCGFCQLMHTRLIKDPCQSCGKRNLILVDYIASVYISWKSVRIIISENTWGAKHYLLDWSIMHNTAVCGVSEMTSFVIRFCLPNDFAPFKVQQFCKCFFYWRIFAKFGPEKYDFELYKVLFKEKGPKFARFWRKKTPYCQMFMISSRLPVDSLEYSWILCFFLLSYLVCSQIWLNCFLDHCHFDYFTKSLKETLLATMWLPLFLQCALRSRGFFSILLVKVKLPIWDHHPITDHLSKSSSSLLHFQWLKCYGSAISSSTNHLWSVKKKQ